MERFRVRASCNNGDHHPTNTFFHSKASASSNSHVPLPPKPPISPQSSLSRRIHDAEISIFDAERYFNGLGDDDQDSTNTSISTSTRTALKKKINSLALNDGANVPRDSSVDGGGYGLRSSTNCYRTRSYRATPTASSEASWNSQTGLLANPPGAVAVSVRAYPPNEAKKAASSRGGPRSFFGRRHCPCYGKKSVDVEDNFSETRSRPVRSHCSPNPSQGFPKLDHVDALSNSSSIVPVMTKFKIRATEPGLLSLPGGLDIGGRRKMSSGTGSFSFPVLISPATAVPALPKELEEPARESLEVFRPPEVRRPVDDDDMASDTSSDLFELESFSAHSSAYRRRDSLEELAKFATATATAGAGMLQFRLGLEETAEAPSECYAPSEASVEWSVTTAEAGFDRTSVANFSSAASDCGKERSDSITVAGNEGGAVKKRGGGGLLSCRCEKAVSVGPNPVRFGPDQQRLVAGPVMLPGPVPVNRSA